MAITAIRDGILFAFISIAQHFITVFCQYDDTDLDLVNWMKLILYGAFSTYYVICLLKVFLSAFYFFEKYTDNVPYRGYYTVPHSNVGETGDSDKRDKCFTGLDESEIIV